MLQGMRRGHWVCDVSPLARAAKVELEFHKNVAHQFLFGQLLALSHESVHFFPGVAHEIFQGDFQHVRCGEDLDFGDVTQLTLLDRPSAPVANVGDHGGSLLVKFFRS